LRFPLCLAGDDGGGIRYKKGLDWDCSLVAFGKRSQFNAAGSFDVRYGGTFALSKRIRLTYNIAETNISAG
jgi:hypothetical protein